MTLAQPSFSAIHVRNRWIRCVFSAHLKAIRDFWNAHWSVFMLLSIVNAVTILIVIRPQRFHGLWLKHAKMQSQFNTRTVLMYPKAFFFSFFFSSSMINVDPGSALVDRLFIFGMGSDCNKCATGFIFSVLFLLWIALRDHPKEQLE